MKAFEEWYETCGIEQIGVLGNRLAKWQAKKGWEAALAWIDDKLDDYSFTYDTNTCCDDSIVSVLGDISTDIKKN